MKLSSALALLFLQAGPPTTAGAALSSSSSSANPSMRRRVLAIPQEDPCILFNTHIDMVNAPATEAWTCELSTKDAERAGRKVVGVEGLTVKDLQQIQSGVTTLLAIGGSLENGMLMVPPGALREFGNAPPRGPLATRKKRSSTSESMKTGSIVTAGVENQQQRAGAEQRTVLAVRVVATDAAPTVSADELSDAIFGTFGDPVNVRERFASCSYGQTLMEPFSGVTSTGATISNGVVEVNIGISAIGRPDTEVVDATFAALAASIGSVENEFDHVMLCLPPGISKFAGYAGYAIMGGYYSVFDNDYCTISRTQVHEIGHNLGLSHANQGDEEYGDDTGSMGNGNYDDDGRLCFNPAKSWQLGWYQDRRMSLDFSSQGPFSGQLVGVDDYQDANANGKYVNLQIVVPGSQQAFYVGFNLAAGINADTAEAQNLVTVQYQDGDSASYLQAAFGAGDSGYISNFINGETLTISVTSIDMNASPPVANIDIYLGDRANQPTTSPSLYGDWELCSRSDQCANGCCSTVYSNDGQLKCTPLDGGFRPDLCIA